jgi:DNA repair protein RadA/Sms
MSGKTEKTVFVCQSCGSQSPKWLGRCPDCGSWNCLVEETRILSRPGPGRWDDGFPSTEAPQPLGQISTQAEQRYTTGIRELDRVLGGGVVPGSAVLIGGDPGIGKSTLLLQTLDALIQDGSSALYISGEESARQIKMRGERLGVGESRVQILAETALENILKTLKTLRPRFLAIDSIQTIFSGDLSSAPGSVSQVRETAGRLILWAKKSVTSLFLVGHVTKEGILAGPRVLEHMVDTVLYFEGERGHSYRILRAVKNRFGSTNEIGVFEMKDAGLAEIEDPSSLFLAERPCDVAGSVVVPSLEGTRPILVELQALVSPSNYGTPRRASMGVDANRVSLLLAVLEKKAGLHLSGQDIFVNVAGGVRLEEPAVDLGIAAALASSFLDRPIPADTIIFGEVGLTGEVRAVSQAEIRVKEAGKLGFMRCLLPRNNLEKLPGKPALELIGVSSLQDGLAALF